jgi:DNA-binding CsgD family transcriptional regulator
VCGAPTDSPADRRAHRVGATALARRGHDELVVAGARPRRVALNGLEALTPSERRAAQLAAGGLGTPEVAQQLFITVNTVETHLRRAYLKLASTPATTSRPLWERRRAAHAAGLPASRRGSSADRRPRPAQRGRSGLHQAREHCGISLWSVRDCLRVPCDRARSVRKAERKATAATSKTIESTIALR